VVGSALHRKLWRECRQMAGQLFAIALVIAAGVMVLVISVSTRQSILLSQQQFYQQNHFADIFAEVTRAPNDLLPSIAALPGVNIIESRIRAGARFQLEQFPEPIQGEILSLPDYATELLNRLHYLAGGPPIPGAGHEIVVSAPFAEAHNLNVGDTITAILNGRMQPLMISGVALSPEFIYQLGPGSIMPDYERFGVFWMSRQALAAAFDMDGAFNSLALSLQAHADHQQIIAELDHRLGRYGSRGAYTRDEHLSHRFISEELAQLRVMAIVLPTIFIGVAAFLLNVLLTRIIQTQKQSIALLKAFGYGRWHIITHYLQMTALILLAGLIAGLLLGVLVAEPLAQLYAVYFRFPEFRFALQLESLVIAILFTALAGVIATFRAASNAAKMAPAEAMRPPIPARYHRTLLDHPRIVNWWQQPTRIMLRNLRRHPFRSIISVFGIALSGGLLLLGSYQFNAIDHMLVQQYRHHHLMDLELTFAEPRPQRSLSTLRAIPGVTYVEGFRQVPVSLQHNRKSWRLLLLGLPESSELRRISQYPEQLPADGVAISQYLATDLELKAGDRIELTLLEGRQQAFSLAIVQIVDEPMGLGLYMHKDALNRLLLEQDTLSGAWVLYDESQAEQVFTALHQLPYVASIGQISRAEADIRFYIDSTMLGIMTVMFLLAGSMTFAVIYNNARIMFAERQRELASLRVLGFHKIEVAKILLGELGLLVALAIPLGWAIGVSFAWLLTQALSMDLFRIPFVLSSQSFALSALGVCLAAAFSMLLMLRKIWRLDMIQALKTE